MRRATCATPPIFRNSTRKRRRRRGAGRGECIICFREQLFPRSFIPSISYRATKAMTDLTCVSLHVGPPAYKIGAACGEPPCTSKEDGPQGQVEWTSNQGECKRRSSRSPPLLSSPSESFFQLSSSFASEQTTSSSNLATSAADSCQMPALVPACLPAECRRVHRSITDEGHPVDALYYRAAYLFCHQHPFRRRYLNRRSSERGIRVPFPLIRRIRPTGR